MRSPIHPEAVLLRKEIEPGLRVFECPKSGGIWMPLQSYLSWRNLHAEKSSPMPEGYLPRLVDDSGRSALLCPESGCILTRYRVGHDLAFQIERSSITGGIWLDQGEWEALKSKGLHSQLHVIFTAEYQAQIRSEAFENALEAMFQKRIGPADFEKAKEVKAWLSSHPKQRDIVCYLMDRSQ